MFSLKITFLRPLADGQEIVIYFEIGQFFLDLVRRLTDEEKLSSKLGIRQNV